MKKAFLEAALMALVAFAIFLGGVFFAGFLINPPTKSEQWASWVQAFGSIAAIVFAYYFGERQAKANIAAALHIEKIAHQEKRMAYLEIASAAHDKVAGHTQWFKGDRSNWISLMLFYDEEGLDVLVKAMDAVPLHDIGSAEAIAAWIATRNAIGYWRSSINEYVAEIKKSKKPAELDLVSIASTIVTQSSAIAHQFKKLKASLERQ